MIDEWQDLPPDEADAMKAIMRVPDEVIQPMYDAHQRWRVSPEVGVNLAGLMTDEEIPDVMPLPEGNAWPPRPKPEEDEDGNSSWFTGIEDRYHDLLVGPCDPDVADAEECQLVWKISVSRLSDFDCTLEEWLQHFRADVLRAVDERPQKPQPPSTHQDIAAVVQRATTTGLEDGTKIVPHGNGWVVIDSFHSYLTDPEDPTWIVDLDDEDMPSAVFPTAEDAYRAWERAEEVMEARAKRREDALKRLGKSAGYPLQFK